MNIFREDKVYKSVSILSYEHITNKNCWFTNLDSKLHIKLKQRLLWVQIVATRNFFRDSNFQFKKYRKIDFSLDQIWMQVFSEIKMTIKLAFFCMSLFSFFSKLFVRLEATFPQRSLHSNETLSSRVSREEGFRRLYRGLPTPLATVALTNSVTFGVYGLASRWALIFCQQMSCHEA